MKRQAASNARRQAAAIFLVAVLAAPVAVMLAWAGPGRAAEPAVGSPVARAGLVPAEGSSWPPLLGRQEGAHLVGVLFEELGQPGEEATAVPAGCQAEAGAPVFVTFYRPPHPPARFHAREATLVESVRSIARQAREEPGQRLRPESLRARVDVLREAWPVPVARRITFAHRGMGEPAGLALSDGETAWFLPGDVASHVAETHEAMLRWTCREAGLQPDAWRREGAQIMLLKADSFVNAAPGSRYVLPCPRGLPPPTEPTLARLLRAARLAGDYLVRVQTPEGAFPAHRDPLTGLAGGCEDLAEQAAVAAALGALCELRPEPAQVTACYAALSGLIAETEITPDEPRMAYTRRQTACGVAFEAETSAPVLEALCRYRRASGVGEADEWIIALAEFLVFMQREDGLLDLSYETQTGARSTPAEKAGKVGPQAGAALALALAYRELDDPRYLAAARRVLDALLAGEAARPEPYSAAAARRLVEAIRYSSAIQPRADHLAWAGRIAAGRRDRQLTAADGVPADMIGGTGAGFPPAVGPTGDDLAVFATVGMMEVGDASAWRAAARRAASFVMHLQFLPENAYYLREPDRSVGGFRERPGSNGVRIATLESALRGLVALARLELQGSSGE